MIPSALGSCISLLQRMILSNTPDLNGAILCRGNPWHHAACEYRTHNSGDGMGHGHAWDKSVRERLATGSLCLHFHGGCCAYSATLFAPFVQFKIGVVSPVWPVVPIGIFPVPMQIESRTKLQSYRTCSIGLPYNNSLVFSCRSRGSTVRSTFYRARFVCS
jgi:hypothetical protein